MKSINIRTNLHIYIFFISVTKYHRIIYIEFGRIKCQILKEMSAQLQRIEENVFNVSFEKFLD